MVLIFTIKCEIKRASTYIYIKNLTKINYYYLYTINLYSKNVMQIANTHYRYLLHIFLSITAMYYYILYEACRGEWWKIV